MSFAPAWAFLYPGGVRCVVTAGPTYEPLDNVRRLTNFSTGRLGSELAHHLAARGHEVILLLGEHATYHPDLPKIELFGTTADLEERLRAASKYPIQAVFHAAAVSDFQFGKVWLRSETSEPVEIKSGKISTRHGTLLAELVPTRKIISFLRDWFPSARLIGWKFEVDGGQADVLKRAHAQLSEFRTDACVANGPAYGPGFGFVTAQNEPIHLADKQALFDALSNFIQVSNG